MLRLGEDCSWSSVPSLVFVNDETMLPNRNARNIPTFPIPCSAPYSWIGCKWRLSVCQMKLTTSHRTFLATMDGHLDYAQPSSITDCIIIYTKICSVFWLQGKTSLKDKDFQALVSTSEGPNLQYNKCRKPTRWDKYKQTGKTKETNWIGYSQFLGVSAENSWFIWP